MWSIALCSQLLKCKLDSKCDSFVFGSIFLSSAFAFWVYSAKCFLADQVVFFMFNYLHMFNHLQLLIQNSQFKMQTYSLTRR